MQEIKRGRRGGQGKKWEILTADTRQSSRRDGKEGKRYLTKKDEQKKTDAEKNRHVVKKEEEKEAEVKIK